MAKPLDHDPMRSVVASLGWHVHYGASDRMRVQLTCDLDAAIDVARTLLGENREVFRLIRCGSHDVIGADAIKKLCAKTSSRTKLPV